MSSQRRAFTVIVLRSEPMTWELDLIWNLACWVAALLCWGGNFGRDLACVAALDQSFALQLLDVLSVATHQVSTKRIVRFQPYTYFGFKGLFSSKSCAFFEGGKGVTRGRLAMISGPSISPVRLWGAQLGLRAMIAGQVADKEAVRLPSAETHSVEVHRLGWRSVREGE